jgi:DNA-binding response OmpR family regulator
MTAGILSKDEGVATSAGGASSLRIAVLDRDSGFIQVLGKRMDRLGWEHRVLASPVPTDALASMRLSALVVDLAVLGPPAWEWLERLCGALPELGIVVCTGPSTVAQRVRGLRLGADDWITKPCHPEEVIARVQGLVRRRRRATARTESKPVSAGEVEIRSDRFQAFVGGRSLELTRREFELIELLASGEGRVLEREEIYSRLWGYAMVRGDRSVDVFVRKLRQKLEKASPEWRYIHTHFGIGYRFAAELEDSAAQNLAAGEIARPAGGDGAAASAMGEETPDDAVQGPPSPVQPPSSAVQGPPSGLDSAGKLDLGERDVRDEGKLGRTQQEYELSTSGA